MDPRRLRTILRAALAVSVASPVAIVIACGKTSPDGVDEADASSDNSSPPQQQQQDALTQPGNDGSQIPPACPPVASFDAGGMDCDAATRRPSPTGYWDGGVYEGLDWIAGQYDAGYILRVAACGCTTLPGQTTAIGATTSNTQCNTYHLAPELCAPGQPSAALPLEQCRTHCACRNAVGHALAGCRTSPELGYLQCQYESAGPSCECPPLLPPTADSRSCGGCGSFYQVGFPSTTCAVPSDGTVLSTDACERLCCGLGGRIGSCRTGHNDAGAPIVLCNPGICIGRRPHGLVEGGPPATGAAVGAWLANASRMEAASVHSFIVLREELLAHGAPSDFIADARRAESDEVRHTRITATLARRLGADEGSWAEAPVVIRRDANRSLEEIARENAVEGCVNETYAALLAMWQAENARDPKVRAAMRAIAEDETRHAALAWAVGSFLDERLEVAERERVAAARDQAVRSLVVSEGDPKTELVEAGILPPRTEALRLVAALERALWRGSSARSEQAISVC